MHTCCPVPVHVQLSSHNKDGSVCSPLLFPSLPSNVLVSIASTTLPTRALLRASHFRYINRNTDIPLREGTKKDADPSILLKTPLSLCPFMLFPLTARSFRDPSISVCIFCCCVPCCMGVLLCVCVCSLIALLSWLLLASPCPLQ